MRKIKKIIVFLLLLIAISFIGISIFTGTQVFEGSTKLCTNENTKDVKHSFWSEYKMNYNDFCKTYKIEKLNISSTHEDNNIPADYIYAKKSDSKKHDTVILVHGLGGNRLTNYPLAKFFLENGYNVLTYDQRSSGENTAKYNTFGIYESRDLIDCVSYINNYIDNSNKLILWGTSFGGATVGISLDNDIINNSVDYAILDCPISNMAWMLEAKMKEMDTSMPLNYLMFCGNIINKIKLGFGYSDVDVCTHAANTKVPVLIFNSKADEVTPEAMGKDIYAALPSGLKKEIYTSDDSEHADIFHDYTSEYEQAILKFIDKK